MPTLNVSFPSTNYYKNRLSYSGAIPWKSIHGDLREAESQEQFKCLLKENVEGAALVVKQHFYLIILITLDNEN